MLLLALLAQTSHGWIVSDITDNSTGKRQVSATQISENEILGDDFSALSFSCFEGEVEMLLRWPGTITEKYVPVTIQWGSGAESKALGQASAWKRSSEGRFLEIPPDDIKRMIESIPDRLTFRITLHRAYSETTAYFLSDGMRAAYDRVAANCKKPAP